MRRQKNTINNNIWRANQHISTNITNAFSAASISSFLFLWLFPFFVRLFSFFAISFSKIIYRYANTNVNELNAVTNGVWFIVSKINVKHYRHRLRYWSGIVCALLSSYVWFVGWVFFFSFLKIFEENETDVIGRSLVLYHIFHVEFFRTFIGFSIPNLGKKNMLFNDKCLYL